MFSLDRNDDDIMAIRHLLIPRIMNTLSFISITLFNNCVNQFGQTYALLMKL